MCFTHIVLLQLNVENISLNALDGKHTLSLWSRFPLKGGFPEDLEGKKTGIPKIINSILISPKL